MCKIIDFPTNEPPRPFRPDTAVRRVLSNSKCDAKIDSKIPSEIKVYLEKQAYRSDLTLSRLTCMVLAGYVRNQHLSGRPQAEDKEKKA